MFLRFDLISEGADSLIVSSFHFEGTVGFIALDSTKEEERGRHGIKWHKVRVPSPDRVLLTRKFT
jgi:hypothetical protein